MLSNAHPHLNPLPLRERKKELEPLIPPPAKAGLGGDSFNSRN